MSSLKEDGRRSSSLGSLNFDESTGSTCKANVVRKHRLLRRCFPALQNPGHSRTEFVRMSRPEFVTNEDLGGTENPVKPTAGVSANKKQMQRALSSGSARQTLPLISPFLNKHKGTGFGSQRSGTNYSKYLVDLDSVDRYSFD